MIFSNPEDDQLYLKQIYFFIIGKVFLCLFDF